MPKEMVIGLLLLFAIVGIAFAGKGLMKWFDKPRVVNINTASARELDELPNVSTSVAEAIVMGRPYTNVSELIRVYGVGPKTLERLRPHVKVE